MVPHNGQLQLTIHIMNSSLVRENYNPLSYCHYVQLGTVTQFYVLSWMIVVTSIY